MDHPSPSPSSPRASSTAPPIPDADIAAAFADAPVPPSSDFDSALEAARLRVTGAKKWARAAAALCESAESQAASSRRELRDAREYLQRLGRKRMLACCAEPSATAEADGVRISPRSSGGREDDGFGRGRGVASTDSTAGVQSEDSDDSAPGTFDDKKVAEIDARREFANDYRKAFVGFRQVVSMSNVNVNRNQVTRHINDVSNVRAPSKARAPPKEEMTDNGTEGEGLPSGTPTPTDSDASAPSPADRPTTSSAPPSVPPISPSGEGGTSLGIFAALLRRSPKGSLTAGNTASSPAGDGMPPAAKEMTTGEEMEISEVKVPPAEIEMTNEARTSSRCTLMGTAKIVGATEPTVDSAKMPPAEEKREEEITNDSTMALRRTSLGKATIVGAKAPTVDSTSLTSSYDDAGYGEIEVTGCGIAALNGRYYRFEASDGVPAYARIATYGGKEGMLTVSRWSSETGTGAKVWRVTATIPNRPKHLVFYSCIAPGFVVHPPRKNWAAVAPGEPFLPPGYEGAGVPPAPAVEYDAGTPRGGVLGMQVEGAGAGCERERGTARKGRRTVHGAPAPRDARRARSTWSARSASSERQQGSDRARG